MQFKPITFPTKGYIEFEISNEELLPIKQEIDKIQNEQFVAKKANQYLVGNIKKEFDLKDCYNHVSNMIMPFIQKYTECFERLDLVDDILTNNVPYVLDKLWVNFQEKYECNPIHMHSGVYTFVIWIKIPYEKKNEIKLFADTPSQYIEAGNFNFVLSDISGSIRRYSIQIDKSMEGKGVFFPSMFNHCVYPFYTSDEYRISVSGNFKYKV